MALFKSKKTLTAEQQQKAERTRRLAERFGGDDRIPHHGGRPGPARRPGGGGGGPMQRGIAAQGKPKNTMQTIARLFGYLKNDIGRLILVMLAMLLNTGSMLVGSYMMRPIINALAEFESVESAVQNLLFGLAVLAGIYLVGVVSSYFQQWWMLGISQKALTTLRAELFDKLQRLPVVYYDTHSAGDLMSRFTNDVDTIGNMLNSTLVQLISGVVTLVGTLLIMIFTNPWLTFVTIVFVPIITFAGQLIAKRSRRYFSAQQAALGAMNGYIEEMVSGQKVIKVFCHEASCKEEFGLLNEDLEKKQLFANFFGGIMGPVMGNLSQVNYAITACVGGILCVLGKFDVGGLGVFVGLARHFARPINEISMQMNVIFSALAGAERVFKVLDAKEPEKDKKRSP